MSPNKKQKTSSSDARESESVYDSHPSTSNTKYDWRDNCKSVLETNKLALKESILTDVTFLVGSESIAYPAHRLLLALGSPVFEAMFYGPLAEKGNTVRIPDVTPEGFHNLLKSLYTNDPNIQNPEVAFETYVAADKYCVTHLREECEKYLCGSKLSPSNIWKILDRAIFWNCSAAVIEHCLKYLRINIRDALQHSSFLEVTGKCLECVLKLESLNTTEINLLLKLVLWADHKLDMDHTQSLQELISPLLKHIRFGILTPSEFILFLEMTHGKNILKSEDALLILKHLVLPLTCPLPSWCCIRTWRDSSHELSVSNSKKCVSKKRKAYSFSDFDSIHSDSSVSMHGSSSSSSSSPSSSSSSSSSESSDSDGL